MNKDAFYFPHDNNARNDDRVLSLRSEFNNTEGYAIYFWLLESMSESSNGEISMDSMAGLSLSYGIAKERLEKVVEFCISNGLFKKSGNKFYSPRMMKHKKFRKERSESGKKGAVMKWSKTKKKKLEFQKMVDFFKGVCVRCEGSSGLAHVERDHIIPTYKGGWDDPTNWQPLCARCNSSKGPEEIDWRIEYCKKHGLAMPQGWLSHSSANAKERKGKERKEYRDFKKPTPNEVSEYAKTLSFGLDGEKFCDYYEARGWKVGKNSIKDWKACVRTWKRNGYESTATEDEFYTKLKEKQNGPKTTV